MTPFHYRGNDLYCEDVRVETLAERYGTPLYVYSHQSVVTNYRRIDRAFQAVDHVVAYSAKANTNVAILRALVREGAGFDLVSGGELLQALRAGAAPEKCIYAGVGKTRDEIALALQKRIWMVNLESLPEAEAVSRIAREMKRTARVAVRVNPDVDPETHRYITTGKKENKFGVAYRRAVEVIREICRMERLEFVGLHSHIGSQIMKAKPYIMALRHVVQLAAALRTQGIPVKTINIGGGFGIDYKTGRRAFPIDLLSRAVVPMIKKLRCTLITEPGRSIVAPAGILLTRLLYVKQGAQKIFYIVDAGMNDLIRPCLYDAYHRIIPVTKPRRAARLRAADVVGPVCESSDFFAKDRSMPQLQQDSLLAICDTGAYGFSMASNYNYRMRPAEVLISGERSALIRQRDRYTAEARKETIPPFLT